MVKRLMMFFAGAMMCSTMVLAQSKVTGTVVSQEDGEPIVGAAVRIEGTNTGTVTDVDGNFSLDVKSGQKLSVSYLGMATQSVTAGPNMRIVLSADNKTLDEVVVVAYGTAKRQSITGAVTAIDAKDIEKHVTTNALSALEGSAPGIQVNSTYGEPGQEPTIRIRGIGTINGSNDPLYVVDGVIYNGNISDLNPSDIASMSRLTLATLVLTSASDTGRFWPCCTARMLSSSDVSDKVKSALRNAASLSAAASGEAASSTSAACGLAGSALRVPGSRR